MYIAQKYHQSTFIVVGPCLVSLHVLTLFKFGSNGKYFVSIYFKLISLFKNRPIVGLYLSKIVACLKRKDFAQMHLIMTYNKWFETYVILISIFKHIDMSGLNGFTLDS